MASDHEVEKVSDPAEEMEEEIHQIRPRHRGVELLCIMETNELEWYDFDEVDVSGLEIPVERFIQHGTPVLDDMAPVWTDVEYTLFFYKKPVYKKLGLI